MDIRKKKKGGGGAPLQSSYIFVYTPRIPVSIQCVYGHVHDSYLYLYILNIRKT